MIGEARAGFQKTCIGWLPVDWPMGCLGDYVAALEAGVSVNATDVPIAPGTSQLGVLKTGAVLAGRFFPEQNKAVLPVDEVRVQTAVRADRVIISRMNTPALVGESGYVPSDFPNLFLPDRLWQTVPSDRPHSQRWLSYWLQLPVIRRLIANGATGTSNSMKNISKELLLSLPVPNVPLQEQRQITVILQVVDDLLDVTASLLEGTRILKRGLMQRVFGRGDEAECERSNLDRMTGNSKVVELGSQVEKVGSGVTPVGGSRSYLSSGIPLIRSQNVLVGKLDLDDVAYISAEQHRKMRNSVVQPNDVLLNITGASIGRCAKVPPNFGDGNVNQHVCIIRPSHSLDSSYLCHYLNSHAGQMQIGRFQSGGNREGLNYQQVRSLKIPIPSLIEQRRIVKLLDGVDAKMENLRAKQRHYQTLKRGLMQKLLTGEWRVKPDADAGEPCAEAA